ncbi:hypothetical protein MTR67_043749 [Solanum verrucosum]|uniref:Uncharacterized protein n=1 Tax=Solanum verrucosum TaxID=315347 RepID=A0AAF0UQW3_SOLVR|nr:hypothetical protein MTR67_043749 [Solanum verrucosum]
MICCPSIANCKVQGHAEDECRVLHPELKLENTTKNYAEDMDKKIRESTNNDTRRRKRVMHNYSNPTNRRFTREGHIGESSQAQTSADATKITTDNAFASLLNTNIMEEQGGEGSRVNIGGNKGPEEENMLTKVRKKDLERDSSLVAAERQEEEEDLLLIKEMAKLHYPTLLHMVAG